MISEDKSGPVARERYIRHLLGGSTVAMIKIISAKDRKILKQFISDLDGKKEKPQNQSKKGGKE